MPDLLETIHERLCVRNARVAIFDQELHEHALELRVDVSPKRREFGRWIVEDLLRDLFERFTFVESSARRGLEQHDAQREKVCSVIDAFEAQLFGRHVAGLALEHVRGGRALSTESLGDPEIGDAHDSIEPDQQVLRRDVAVHERGWGSIVRDQSMRRAQALGRLQADLHDDGERQQVAGGERVPDQLLQREPLDVVHQEVGATLVLADVEHPDHVRMLKQARQASFLEEHLTHVRLVDEVRVRAFHRVDALELSFATQDHLDDAEAAFRDPPDLDVAGALVDRRVHDLMVHAIGMGTPAEYQRAMRGDFTQVESDAARLGAPWSRALHALLANTLDGHPMPLSDGVGAAPSLVHRQHVLRAALAWDRSTLEDLCAFEVSEPLVDALKRRWVAVFDGAPWVEVDASIVRAGGEVDPSLVVELHALRALHALNAGRIDDALSTARRASRMAASESILQGEYLANLVLARARRHAGMAHYAIRVLGALDSVVPPMWKPWIAVELALAGARPLGASPSGFDQIGTEAATLLAVSSIDAPELASAQAWIRGDVHDVPFGLRAPSDDPLCLAVVVADGSGARRVLRSGTPGDCPLIEPSPKARRLHESMSLILSKPGLPEAELFEHVYGYPPEDLGHDGVLRGLLHRIRKALEGFGTLERDDGRLRIVPTTRFAVPDPRCETSLDDRILTFLAAQRGRATAKDIAQAMQIPLRTVQRKLGRLVEDGACAAEKDRKRTEYVVEDTTFSEPTLHRLRGKR